MKNRACCFLLLFALSLSSFAEQPALPATEAAYDKAINAVYPALVQIYVLAVQHGGGRERKFQASGSGAIISADGHVVTNHHVAGKAVAIRCVLSTKEELEATLIGTDALTDIAILKLNVAARKAGAPPLAVARWGNSNEIKVGDTVLAMGCPLALSQSVTRGIVANKDMILPRGGLEMDGEDVGSLVKWIGHDATIQPGNSGGPLVNVAGEIVGVNEIGIGAMSGAIPSDIAKTVAAQLIESGKVQRAFVGASFQPLLKSMQAGLPVDAAGAGVLVGGVLPGSPAEAAGLRGGDIVTAIDGQPIQVRFREELPPFVKLLAAKPVGQSIAMKVKRGNEDVLVSLKTDLRDEARAKETEVKEWGLTVRRLTVIEAKQMMRPDMNGVLVGSVRPGGGADKAQPPISPYDVIVTVGGKAVPDIATFLKVTADIVKDQPEPVPTVVAFDRGAERRLTLVEIGIRPPQDPPAESKKAWLPVATQVLSKKLAAALNLKGKKGVIITQVYPDSSAEQEGFKVGDVLTHIDTVQIDASEPQDTEVFNTMLRAYKAGAKAEFTGFRDGQPLTISSVLTEGPKAERELKTYEDLTLEFQARDISYMDRVKNRWKKDEQGAYVSQVDAGGWAAVGTLSSGDLIQAINDKKVNDVKDLETVLKALLETKPKQISIFVKRGIQTTFVELEPNWQRKENK